MFVIQSLGGVRIQDSSGVTVRLRSRKHVALFLYLAAAGRRVCTRDSLARLLWNTPLERARHSLSQALYDLRRNLPGTVGSATGDAVSLDPATFQLDALEFERALKKGDLSLAVDLYRGPFADNLSQTGTEDFQRWLEQERLRLLRLGEMALRRYVRQRDEAGQWGEMCVAALRLVKLSPLDEEAHRTLMRGLWLHGDAPSAIRHYEEAVLPMQSELPGGISQETLLLVDRIRSTPAPEPWVDNLGELQTPFLGREEEMEILRAAVRRIAEAPETALLVSGEAGIGKSRLVSEFTRSMGLNGIRQLESRCFPAEADVPYGPVIDGLRPIAAELASERAADLESLTRVGHLLPELEHFVRDGEQRIDPAAWRRRLYEEVTSLVRLSLDTAPVVWVIEDVQWMDATSRSLLHYMTRRLEGYPFLLIATLRVPRGSDLPSTLPLSSPGSSDLTREVRLQPLTVEEIGEILSRASPESGYEGAVHLAQRLAGGNPFFALEVFRAAVGSTEWAVEASRWDPLTDVRLSKVLAVRLKGLSQQSRRVLQATAVLERQATPGSVSSVAGLTLPEAAEASIELYGRGLLQDNDAQLGFVNDIVREYVYADMTALSRTALHLTAAEFLEQSSETNEATLARHFHLGEDRPRTYLHAVQAARDAKASAGQMEAAAMADLAVKNSNGKAQRLTALHLLAEAELESAQLPQAKDHLNEILRLDDDMAPEQRVEVKLMLVEALAEAADWSQARAAIESVNRLLDSVEDPSAAVRARAETLYWTLKVTTRQNDAKGASEAARRAQRLSNRALEDSAIDTNARVNAVLSYASYAAFYESSERAMSLLDDVRDLVELADPEIAERARLVRGTVAIRMARWDEGEYEFSEALRHASKRNDLVQQAGLWNNLACSALEQGDWSRFSEWAGKVEDVRVCDTLDTLLLLTLNRANALFYQGRAQAAVSLYGRALETVDATGSAEFRPEILSCQGLIALQLGDTTEVGRVWRDILGTTPSQLLGTQELFKYEWFRAFMGKNLGLDGTPERLLAAAREQSKLDVLSHYKLMWLGSVLFGDTFATLAGRQARDSRRDLFDNRLGWFAGFAQRWARAAAAKSGSAI
ncbi:MAG: AAA family ATPase [marine benthic group bacterium]|nr:AAA family ATPase [Candidatus Benthicola marisminoris]